VSASANLDLVRSIYADWERGDFSHGEWADPEIEVVIADGPAPGTWTGRAGMAQSHREFLSAYEGLRMVTDEYRELDEERVLVLVRIEGRGKTSGVDLGQIMSDRESADLFHIRDGQVTRLVIYYDTDRALADLGLEE
jgi:ketosteroid isomerase-like protein